MNEKKKIIQNYLYTHKKFFYIFHYTCKDTIITLFYFEIFNQIFFYFRIINNCSMIIYVLYNIYDLLLLCIINY